MANNTSKMFFYARKLQDTGAGRHGAPPALASGRTFLLAAKHLYPLFA
jgi:hypothetical protein